jgi:hypothetical protein
MQFIRMYRVCYNCERRTNWKRRAAVSCTIVLTKCKKTVINGRGDSLRWPRDTLYPLKLALTSPTSGCRSVGIVHWRTTAEIERTMISSVIIIGFWSDNKFYGFNVTRYDCYTLNRGISIYLWLYSHLLGHGRFSVPWSLYTASRTPWTGISPSQGLYLHTGQRKHRINKQR